MTTNETKTKHTPGPWYSAITPTSGTWVGSDPQCMIGIARIFGDSDEETEANAALIAAAPDLLEALKALHSCHRAFSNDPEMWTALDDDARKQAEAAIEKAEGGES